MPFRQGNTSEAQAPSSRTIPSRARAFTGTSALVFPNDKCGIHRGYAASFYLPLFTEAQFKIKLEALVVKLVRRLQLGTAAA